MDVLVSGGFDPLHIGHLRYLQEARVIAGEGGHVFVCLNSDEWLIAKKGYVFMPADQRREILMELKCVDDVFVQDWQGNDMAPAIQRIKPDIFAKGGDRRSANDLPKEEVDACIDNGVAIVFGVGGFDKPASSSKLIENATQRVRGLTNIIETKSV